MHCAIYRGENKMTSTYSVGSGDRIYLNYNSPSDAQGSNLRLGGWTINICEGSNNWIMESR